LRPCCAALGALAAGDGTAVGAWPLPSVLAPPPAARAEGTTVVRSAARVALQIVEGVVVNKWVM
jgi:hypothetical protein